MDTKESSNYFHNKVLILNIALTFVIVMLHSKPLNRIGINNEGDYALIHAVVVFAQVGVPMFFFISALLFYNNLDFIMIKNKLKRRLRTLVMKNSRDSYQPF